MIRKFSTIDFGAFGPVVVSPNSLFLFSNPGVIIMCARGHGTIEAWCWAVLIPPRMTWVVDRPAPTDKTTMPIKFHCPHAECGKPLTVSDQAAGRAGKCPGCGGPIVVPRPEAASEDLPYDLELLPDPEPAPEPVRRSKATPLPVSAPLADDPDWAPVAAKGAGGPVVSFDAVGLAWRLFTSRMGTWVLAVFLVGLLQVCCQIALSIVMAPVRRRPRPRRSGARV